MERRIQFPTVVKNDLLIDDYVLWLKNVLNHHAVIGEAVSICDLFLHAISGLYAIYNHFISSFTMHSDASSFDKFHNQLLTYEKRLEQQGSQDLNKFIQTNLTKFVRLNLALNFLTLEVVIITRGIYKTSCKEVAIIK